MNYSPILIVGGEPNSIFSEIYIKTLNKKKIKSPLVLIYSEKILIKQMKKLKFKKNINLLDPKNLNFKKINNKSINLIDIEYYQKKAFEKISNKSNKFIKKSFQMAFKILREKKIFKLINGPISKKYFLKKKYLGITEYIAKEFNTDEFCMLIYNPNLSVCPITTHLPIKQVAKNLNKKKVFQKIKLIDNFYKKILGFKPKISVLGLNPHCESIDKYNEEENIIKPAIKKLSKNCNVSGPFSADTIFLRNNRKHFDVIVGMYHDQVLTPVKTIYEYNAINITLGLPFLRISPDHGPNEKMLGKNKSNPLSLIKAISFLEKN